MFHVKRARKEDLFWNGGGWGWDRKGKVVLQYYYDVDTVPGPDMAEGGRMLRGRGEEGMYSWKTELK